MTGPLFEIIPSVQIRLTEIVHTLFAVMAKRVNPSEVTESFMMLEPSISSLVSSTT